MVDRVKTAEFRHLRNLECKGGAKVEQRLAVEAGEAHAETPLLMKSSTYTCSTLSPKVEQRWSKVEQQGGLCSTHRDPLKGALVGRWSSPRSVCWGGANAFQENAAMTFHVTQHAIERYQERIDNCSDDEARAALSAVAIKAAADFGCQFVRLPSGHRVAIKDHTVTTILPPQDYRKQVQRIGATDRRKKRQWR